jgi:RNA polymerase sigma factor (sigma-70 family)
MAVHVRQEHHDETAEPAAPVAGLPVAGLHLAAVGDDGTVDRDAAVAALFRLHYDRLSRIALLIVGDSARAEELVQEAYFLTWRHWDRIRSPGAAPFYLQRTVVNLARSSLRRRMVELRHLLGDREAIDDPDHGQRLDLERALAKLPARKRACVVLRHYADCSEQETAELLASRSAPSRARRRRGSRCCSRSWA